MIKTLLTSLQSYPFSKPAIFNGVPVCKTSALNVINTALLLIELTSITRLFLSGKSLALKVKSGVALVIF